MSFIPGFGATKISLPTIEAPVSLNKQSYTLPGPERIHLSMLSNSKREYLEKSFSLYDDVQTIYDCIRRGLVQSDNGNCLGYRPNGHSGYQWLSYENVINRSVNFGRGLCHLGVKEKNMVGIYSKNRVEWVLTEQGIYSFSMVSVPLYDTLGPTACHFIITQAEIMTIVLETEKNLLDILENIPNCLKTVIHMDELSENAVLHAEKLGLRVYKFSEVERIGEEHKSLYPEKPPKPDDIASLSYTSGTTGTPKGTMLTHSNVVSAICSCLANGRSFDKNFSNKNDVMLSFLPLAHVMERMVEGIALMEGVSIGFYSGDVLKLLDDIKFLKPTVFPCVPRLLNRIYDKVIGASNESYLKRLIIQTALRFKGKEIQRGIKRRNSIWDYLVFNKVQTALGGRVGLVLSGGAPINPDVLKFFRCALGCTVMEGYGQTETFAMVATTLLHESVGGHVGPPTLAIASKLVDVPEMNYYAKNDQGELCCKGPMVFKGYYKNEEETKKAIDEDGWLHTGDIATWIPNGCIKIIDRKKNIFKLSQGEYIAPEKIETIYLACQLVAQIFVYGESIQSFLVGIVVPDPEVIKRLYPDSDMPTICNNPTVKSLIQEELTKLGKECGLMSFEQVKDIYLHPDLFTVEQGLLTPTMKARRPELKEFFKAQIHRMYDSV